MTEFEGKTLAAVLFTDIAGFTALMEGDEAKALQVRERHLHTLKEIHNKYCGQLIKHLGDGSLSVFPAVEQALKAASELQEKMQSRPEIPLRVGLHYDEILHLSGDIAGSGVNIASRIESVQ